MTASHLASVLKGEADSFHWERLLSGEGGDVLDLQFGEHDDILAVTRLGLFRSADEGEHWHRVEAPPLIRTLHRSDGWWLGTEIGLFSADRLDGSWQPKLLGTSVTGVAVDEESKVILAFSVEDGLLRSEDWGNTWEDANPGLPGDEIVAMHRSPTFERDQTFFVATESGVFRSRNGGRAWRQIPLPTEDIQCFTIDDNQLLVGTGGDGCWMSTDSGRTWRQVLSGSAIFGFGTSRVGDVIVLSDSGLITIDANDGDLCLVAVPLDALCAIETGNRRLVGTVGHGVVRQMPEGGEWVASSTGLEATPRDRVRVLGHAQMVTISSSGGVLQSENSGASWHEVLDAPLESVLDFDVRIDPENGLEFVACDGHRASIYRDTWRELDAASPLAVAWFDREPAMITADGRFVYGEFQTNMLPRRLRLTGARLIPVQGHPTLLWSVLQLEDEGVIVLRSPDGGKEWELLLHTDAAVAVSLAVSFERSGRENAILAVGNGIYRMLESPAPVWTGEVALAISAIAVAPDDSILLATNHGLIVLSQDLAISKCLVGSPAPLLDVDIESNGSVIVVERGGSIWRLVRTSAA